MTRMKVQPSLHDVHHMSARHKKRRRNAAPDACFGKTR